MNHTIAIVAMVFDFDDTLVPDSTTGLLSQKGVDTETFWSRDVRALVESGYDPATAYLNLLLRNIGDGKALGPLADADLRAFGETLDKHYYEGLPDFFNDLRRQVSDTFSDIQVEFYIVSGGLQKIIEGSKIVQTYFKAVYGSQLAGDTDNGVLKYIKRCVTFTEKTRYLFEIHKGLDPKDTRRNPFLVNTFRPPNKRPVPFSNMIYVGDGLTDIPCFSLVKSQKGMAFGVFDPAQEKKAKQALQDFLKPDRVISMHAPRYRKTDELGALLRAAVANRCSLIQLEREQAEKTEY